MLKHVIAEQGSSVATWVPVLTLILGSVFEAATYVESAKATNSWSPGNPGKEFVAAMQQFVVHEVRVEDDRLRDEVLGNDLDPALRAVWLLDQLTAPTANAAIINLWQSADRALGYLGSLLRGLY